MKAKVKKSSRLSHELFALAGEMHSNGTMDNSDFEKITMRHLNKADSAKLAPLSGREIRMLREQSKMSQAVFAHHLNLTVGYVSQLERGAKRPTGSALALLDVIRRKGMDALI